MRRMNRQQALELMGGLRASRIREVWEAASPVAGTDLCPGLWLGRNGGMPWPMKRLVRHVVRRDWFSKLVLDGWGINVRVRQDGSYAILPSRTQAGSVRVDLPFRLTEHGLDYGYHVLGRDTEPVGMGLQIRDYLRVVGLRTLGEIAGADECRRVGTQRGDGDDDTRMVIGYIAPIGAKVLMGTPFGMVWEREATAAERASAEQYLRRRRLWDSSPGRGIVSSLRDG
jgi:hypothetical protein